LTCISIVVGRGAEGLAFELPVGSLMMETSFFKSEPTGHPVPLMSASLNRFAGNDPAYFEIKINPPVGLVKCPPENFRLPPASPTNVVKDHFF